MSDGKWSQMSPQELLDEAQAKFAEVAQRSPNANGLHGGLIRAQALMAAAQVQATENLTWTLQNRTSIGSPEMPEGWTP